MSGRDVRAPARSDRLHLPAIDVEHDAGNETRSWRGEEDDGGGKLVRLAEALEQRDVGQDAPGLGFRDAELDRLLPAQVGHALGIERSKVDRVDPDVEWLRLLG